MEAAADIELVGGRLCLDLANTVSNYFADVRRDYLADYGDLVGWARHAGAIDDTEARHLAREAVRRPQDAEAALARTRELREAIFTTFHAIAYGKRPPATAIATLNASLANALGKQQLERDGDAWVLRCVPPGGDLEAPLWPIARSAAELLTDNAVHCRIHVCGGAEHDCTWMFVDESKSGKRRWCTMRDCGNRAKARRHYERTRHA
jgi:predicted RNA-binding Zn ribbon-like protein